MTRAWDKEKYSEFFFVPCSCHCWKNPSSLFITELKIHHLYYLLHTWWFRHCWSQQYAVRVSRMVKQLPSNSPGIRSVQKTKQSTTASRYRALLNIKHSTFVIKYAKTCSSIFGTNFLSTFSDSLIIHLVNTKEIRTVTAVWNRILISIDL